MEEIRDGFIKERAYELGLSGRNSEEGGSHFLVENELVQRHRNLNKPGPLEAVSIVEKPPGLEY